MKFQRLIQLSTILSLVVSLSVPLAFAGTGVDALVKVKAVDPSNVSASGDLALVPNAFVNMYEIILVNNEYTGGVIATMSTGKDGATFTVKPGQVVDFMAFGSKEAADKQKSFVTNGVPPMKNFSMDDGVAGVCNTNGADFSKKLAAVTTDCWNAINVSITGPLPQVTVEAPKVKGKNVTYKVQVVEKTTEQNLSKEPVLIPSQFVNMYAITLVNNEYVGTLIKTIKSGKKVGAPFVIKPGQVVDFMGFSTKELAKAAKNFMTNGVPPMKNFSPTYGPGLCHTNGIDFNEKLPGASMCDKKGIVELSK